MDSWNDAERLSWTQFSVSSPLSSLFLLLLFSRSLCFVLFLLFFPFFSFSIIILACIAALIFFSSLKIWVWRYSRPPFLADFSRLESLSGDITQNHCIINTSKASGPDLMSPRLLKEGSSILAEPYSILYTSSLRLGHFPSFWKDGNVTAIHKKDDRSKPSNYRPIS